MSDMFGIGTAVQAGTSLASAGIQSAAINRATDAQAQAAQNSLNFQKDQFQYQKDIQAPYAAAGQVGLNNIQGSGLLSYGGTPLDNGFFGAGDTQTAQFNPNIDITQDPSYQFRLQQGMQALQRSQAATGISGGAAAKAISDYAQGSASQEYANAYQRALQTSSQNASINNQNFGQDLNTYNANANHSQQMFNEQQQVQGNIFNRNAALAGVGQTSVNQLQNAGQSAVAANNATTAQLGNALSAGSAAQGNVWGNAMNQGGNALNSYLLNRGQS